MFTCTELMPNLAPVQATVVGSNSHIIVLPQAFYPNWLGASVKSQINFFDQTVVSTDLQQGIVFIPKSIGVLNIYARPSDRCITYNFSIEMFAPISAGTLLEVCCTIDKEKTRIHRPIVGQTTILIDGYFILQGLSDHTIQFNISAAQTFTIKTVSPMSIAIF